MQNRTEQQAERRARQGAWQYPGSPVKADAAVETAPSTVPAPPVPARAFARRTGADGARGQQLGTLLGWLSIGIGVAHLLAPRAVARASGLPASGTLLRAIGMREMVCGVGLLNRPASPAWRWTRVAGDAIDLALLGTAARRAGDADGRKRLNTATLVVAGVTALDVLASAQSTPWRRGAAQLAGAPVPVEKSVTVNRTAEQCYRFWRELEQLPRFMGHLESVRTIDARRSHWKARGPAGTSIEWDAEITADEPGRRLAWRSVEGADVAHSGEVSFNPAPGGRGTVVSVRMHYAPPGGKAGAAAARLLGEEPGQQIDDALRRFKQLLETGEIATTHGQPAGARSLKARLFNFARGARP